MDRKSFAILSGLLLAIPASTQSQAPGSASASPRAVLQGNISNLMSAEGTEINAALVSALDSKKTKPGDEIVALATETIKLQGKVVVPMGAKLIGHITRASARGRGDAESAIWIVFDRIILKNGKEITMRGGINALASADAEPILSATGTRSIEEASSNAIEGAVNTIAYSTSRVPHAVPRTFGGLTENGQFVSDSRGVFGVDGLRLSAVGSNDTDGTVIASTGNNVHVKSGTRLLIVFRQAGEKGSASV